MIHGKTESAVNEIKQFAQKWNELYAATQFEEMKSLATEDVGIANAAASNCPTGLIYGRQAYYDGIYGAYKGTGNQQNLLVMQYESWEYIQISEDTFYTIGKYTLQNSPDGVNCWLLKRQSDGKWLIFRVINN